MYFKGAMKRKFLLMQINNIVEWLKLLFQFFDIYFISALSIFFAGLADDIICLHKVKRVYKTDHSSEEKSNKKTCFY